MGKNTVLFCIQDRVAPGSSGKQVIWQLHFFIWNLLKHCLNTCRISSSSPSRVLCPEMQIPPGFLTHIPEHLVDSLRGYLRCLTHHTSLWPAVLPDPAFLSIWKAKISSGEEARLPTRGCHTRCSYKPPPVLVPAKQSLWGHSFLTSLWCLFIAWPWRVTGQMKFCSRLWQCPGVDRPGRVCSPFALWVCKTCLVWGSEVWSWMRCLHLMVTSPFLHGSHLTQSLNSLGRQVRAGSGSVELGFAPGSQQHHTLPAAARVSRAYKAIFGSFVYPLIALFYLHAVSLISETSSSYLVHPQNNKNSSLNPRIHMSIPHAVLVTPLL